MEWLVLMKKIQIYKKLLILCFRRTKFFSYNCKSVQEYENQCTAEAKFVKQLDQCEMILQAFEYEELENTPGRLQDFYDSTAGMTFGHLWGLFWVFFLS